LIIVAVAAYGLTNAHICWLTKETSRDGMVELIFMVPGAGFVACVQLS
jgi:hypothetical protein